MPRVIITVPDRTPQPYKFPLDRQRVSIGRGSVNDIAVDSGSVSVTHAEMVRVPGGYELRDLASTNGIKRDGERMEVIRLQDGLDVTLGDVGFDFSLAEEERELLARENACREHEDTENPAGEAVAAPRETAIPKAAPRRAAPQTAPNGGGGMWLVSFVLFLLFAGAAFFAGMSLHYYRDTGGSLWDAIQTKSKTIREIQGEKGQPSPAPVR